MNTKTKRQPESDAQPLNEAYRLQVTKKTGATITEEFVGKSYASVIGRVGRMFPGASVRMISGPYPMLPILS